MTCLSRGASWQAACARANSFVLCFDLDLFKNVNDSLGYPMGDRLLKLVAGRLRPQVCGNNLAARLGDDVFEVILRRLAERSER